MVDTIWWPRELKAVVFLCVCFHTLGVPVVRGVLWQPVEVIFEQQLIARNPLNRLQHVVLQSQVPTALLPLHRNIKHTFVHNNV